MLETGNEPPPELIELVRKKKNHELVRERIEKGGCDVDVCDADGTTAMHHALEHASEEMAVLLLDAGANPYKADAKGETPYQFAVKHNQFWFVQKVMTKYRAAIDLDQELLTFSPQYNWRVSETLIQLGARPGRRDGEGRTALHWYILTYKGFLIRNFESIDRDVLDAKDNYDHTALWYANTTTEYCGRAELVRLGAIETSAFPC
jgi:ankyrin repeat protein